MKKFKADDRVIRTGPSIGSEGMLQGHEYEVHSVNGGPTWQTLMIWVSGDRVLGYDSVGFELAPVGDPDDSPVEHPKHYNSHPSGVECIEIARHHNFNIGNVFKYLWRLGLKGGNATTKAQRLEEIDKAIFYLQDERARIEAEG